MNGDAFSEMVECAIPKLDSILSAHRQSTCTAPSELAFAFPVAVCSAFAIELYLKAIMGMEKNGDYDRVHNIFDLFESVSPSSKNEIEFPYGSDGGQFFSKLKDARFVFEEARYIDPSKKGLEARRAENENALAAENVLPAVDNKYLYELMNRCKKRAHDLQAICFE